MPTRMLFYENAVPVSSGRHAGCSVDVRGYAFSGAVNSVPLMAVEFATAVGEYPIVFAGADDALRPVAVLGLRHDENLFVSGSGAWQGRYVPAFVRRYPFVFSAAPDNRFLLCVDEAFTGFNREGRGEALFAEDGQPTPYVGKVLRFLQDYRAQFIRTTAFCRRLRELDLLEPMRARIGVGAAQLSLGGFSTVNRDKLRALAGDMLAELARSDELDLLYLHLHSLRNFEVLRARLPPPAAPAHAGPGVPTLPADTDHPAVIH